MPHAASYAFRTARTLELVAAGPVSAQEVADALGVDVRTARALLRRLAADGFVLRRPHRAAPYHAGPRLHRLAARLRTAPSR